LIFDPNQFVTASLLAVTSFSMSPPDPAAIVDEFCVVCSSARDDWRHPKGNRNALKHGASSAETLALKRQITALRPDGWERSNTPLMFSTKQWRTC